MTTKDEAIKLLREIRDEVRGLRADLAEQRALPASKAPARSKNPEAIEKLGRSIATAMADKIGRAHV